MPVSVVDGNPNTYYHVALNKLVTGHVFADPPGIMELAPDRVSWLTPAVLDVQTRYLDISALYAPALVAPYDEASPSLPLIFCYNLLTASAEFKAIHGDPPRLVEDVRANTVPKSDKPFCVISATSKPNVYAGVPEIVTEWRSMVTVLSVRRYENGAGSWVDFDASFKAMRRALCGVADYKVFLNSVIMGTVEQSMFLDEVKFERRETGDDVQTLHQGILFELAWQT